MTRVLERWDRVLAMDSPAGYAYPTALNLNRKRVRRAVVRARRVFASIPAEGHTAAVGDRHDVHRALAALPAGQREALVLIAAPSGPGIDSTGRLVLADQGCGA